MADVKWIKITTDIFENRKIRQIEALPDGDAVIVVWLKLLCLAGQINDQGAIYFTKEIPYTEEMMATQFNRPLSTIKMALQVFQQFGMIEIESNILNISNWEKYQNIDGLERIREQNRIRKQRQREKEKLALTDNGNVTSHVTVTQGHATDIDIDKDIDKDIDNIKEKDILSSKDNNISKKKKFVPPTPEEVKEYCDSKNYNIDSEYFVDFYTSKGWMVGSNKMKDWKAAVRTWVRNNKNKPNDNKVINKSSNDKEFSKWIDETFG